MTLLKDENQERMRIRRAAQKEDEKTQERNAIIDGVVTAVVAAVNDKIAELMAVQLNQISGQRKMSCQEESFQVAPQTPPRLMITGGTRGRSPAALSGDPTGHGLHSPQGRGRGGGRRTATDSDPGNEKRPGRSRGRFVERQAQRGHPPGARGRAHPSFRRASQPHRALQH